MIPDWMFWYLMGIITAFVIVAAIGAWFDRKERKLYARRQDTFQRHLRQLADVDTYIQTRGGRIQ